MKRFSAIFLSLLLLFFATPLINSKASAAATSAISITDRTHQLFDGTFFDDELITSLTPNGRLGALLYKRSRGPHTWIIDVSLLEEIQVMSKGYKVLNEKNEVVDGEGTLIADLYLSTLKSAIGRTRVSAFAYGNPDTSWLNKAAPGELQRYQNAGRERLALFLNREIDVDVVPNITGASLLSRDLHTQYAQYTLLRKKMRGVSKLATSIGVENDRLRIAKLLNPLLTKAQSAVLAKNYVLGVGVIENKIRLVVGKYTITSTKEKIPITVVNDFDTEITLLLEVLPQNGKVIVEQPETIILPAQSKVEVALKVEVVASGSSVLLAQLFTVSGEPVGSPKRLPLNLTVISPITTWFTTGSAILLLLAAVVQSVRRVNRRKNE